MPYIGKKPENIIATAVDTTTGDFSGNVTTGGTHTVTGVSILTGGIDVSGTISLDADSGSINLLDGGTTHAELINSSNDFIIKSSQSDKDMIFKGVDGGSLITALTLDMSDAGAATFNGVVTANAGIKIDNITIDSTEVDLSSGSFTIDSAANITLDCGTGEFLFNNGGNGNLLKIQADSSNVNFIGMVQDKDLVFKGNDGGSTITALTLDMSASGDAIFNRNADFSDSGRARFGAGADLQIYHDGSNNYFNGSGDHNFLFLTNGGEKLRIRNGGFLRASNNLNVSSHSRLSATTAHVFHSHTDGSIMFFYENTQADPYGYMIDFSQAAPDDNTNHFAKFEDSSAERCIIYSDGDIKNHDNSYGSLSDERIKDNITDANSQWDDIKALKVRNFQLKDDIRQYGADKAKSMIGIIAQEAETAGMDGLIKHADPNKGNVLSDSTFGTVYEDGDDIPDGKAVGDVKEIKEKVKGVSYSVLYMKAIKALQEAMTRIETLESSNTALAARIKTLEDA